MAKTFFLPRIMVIALIGLQHTCSSTAARQVSYSFSGYVVPIASEDPWQIGHQGKSFNLSLKVPPTTSDLLNLNVEFAAFNAESISMAMNGDELSYVGDGSIDFTDNHAGLFDIVHINGRFESLGNILDIGASITLPENTFQFSTLAAAPPAFNLALAASQTAYGGRGPYAAITPIGTEIFVTTVPEPGAFSLLAICIPLTRLRRLRRHGEVDPKNWAR